MLDVVMMRLHTVGDLHVKHSTLSAAPGTELSFDGAKCYWI